ncbi:unnamed protein product [Microthlaspi erraticum]|uniref:Acetyl-CoA carboxylase central domain-containing protein n=1 Tax=Microthlaspi erraticum TaxID=1685480 RepID=A0A6D2JSC7_9BRAS|nr:unnamed protein product [Microthlaspi erraticum]
MHKTHDPSLFDILKEAMEVARQGNRVIEERNIQVLVGQMHIVKGQFEEGLKMFQQMQYTKDLLKILDIVLSHQGIKNKNKLVLRLMEQLVYPNPAAYRDKLIRFSTLDHTNYSELALKASQLLEQTKLSELRSNIARSLSELAEDGENMDTPKRKSAINERMEDLVSALTGAVTTPLDVMKTRFMAQGSAKQYQGIID